MSVKTALRTHARVSLPDVDGWGTNYNIQKLKPQGVYTKPRHTVGDEIVSELRQSDHVVDLVADHINVHPRSINPSSAVNYTNVARNACATSGTVPYLPKRIMDNGEFRLPERAFECTEPLSRMPRKATYIEPTAVYSIEPLVQPKLQTTTPYIAVHNRPAQYVKTNRQHGDKVQVHQDLPSRVVSRKILNPEISVNKYGDKHVMFSSDVSSHYFKTNPASVAVSSGAVGQAASEQTSSVDTGRFIQTVLNKGNVVAPLSGIAQDASLRHGIDQIAERLPNVPQIEVDGRFQPTGLDPSMPGPTIQVSAATNENVVHAAVQPNPVYHQTASVADPHNPSAVEQHRRQLQEPLSASVMSNPVREHSGIVLDENRIKANIGHAVQGGQVQSKVYKDTYSIARDDKRLPVTKNAVNVDVKTTPSEFVRDTTAEHSGGFTSHVRENPVHVSVTSNKSMVGEDTLNRETREVRLKPTLSVQSPFEAKATIPMLVRPDETYSCNRPAAIRRPKNG